MTKVKTCSLTIKNRVVCGELRSRQFVGRQKIGGLTTENRLVCSGLYKKTCSMKLTLRELAGSK